MIWSHWIKLISEKSLIVCKLLGYIIENIFVLFFEFSNNPRILRNHGQIADADWSHWSRIFFYHQLVDHHWLVVIFFSLTTHFFFITDQLSSLSLIFYHWSIYLLLPLTFFFITDQWSSFITHLLITTDKLSSLITQFYNWSVLSSLRFAPPFDHFPFYGDPPSKYDVYCGELCIVYEFCVWLR